MSHCAMQYSTNQYVVKKSIPHLIIGLGLSDFKVAGADDIINMQIRTNH